MTDDMKSTVKQVDKMVKNNEGVHNVSKEVQEQSQLLDKKVDAIMARLIQLTNFGQIEEEEEDTEDSSTTVSKSRALKKLQD